MANFEDTRDAAYVLLASTWLAKTSSELAILPSTRRKCERVSLTRGSFAALELPSPRHRQALASFVTYELITTGLAEKPGALADLDEMQLHDLQKLAVARFTPAQERFIVALKSSGADRRAADDLTEQSLAAPGEPVMQASALLWASTFPPPRVLNPEYAFASL